MVGGGGGGGGDGGGVGVLKNIFRDTNSFFYKNKSFLVIKCSQPRQNERREATYGPDEIAFSPSNLLML